jgi:hypothetical protein
MISLDDFKPKLSGISHIDALLSLEWYRPTPWPANQPIRYAFLEDEVLPEDPGGLHITVDSYTEMNLVQKSATEELMGYVSDLLNLPVIEVSSAKRADIFFASDDLSGNITGLANRAYVFEMEDGEFQGVHASALVLMDISDVGSTATDAPVRGNLGYEVLLHEIGHALGLSHPFSGPNAVPAGADNKGLSIMSYTSGPEPVYDRFQEWDLAALSYLYPSMDRTPVVTGTSGVDVYEIEAEWNPGGSPDQDVVADPDTIALTLGGDIIIFEDIERLSFENGTLAFDWTGTAGQVYRLYHAAYDREPDPEGMGFWVRQMMDTELSLIDVAEHFLGSPEFNERYGAKVEDAVFLEAVYLNVLDREPDASGYTFWSDVMNMGVDRADIIIGFSESIEHMHKLSNNVVDGMWYW